MVQRRLQSNPSRIKEEEEEEEEATRKLNVDLKRKVGGTLVVKSEYLDLSLNSVGRES